MTVYTQELKPSLLNRAVNIFWPVLLIVAIPFVIKKVMTEHQAAKTAEKQ